MLIKITATSSYQKVGNNKQNKENSLINQLPPEMSLNIFKFLHEQDIENYLGISRNKTMRAAQIQIQIVL